MRKKISLIASILLVLVIITAYWGITKTFYQQDEWLGYGLYLAKGSGIIFQNANSFWDILFGKGRILTNLLQFIFHRYSPLNTVPVSIFAILLHVINTLLVFHLANKIIKNTFAAFLGALFFAVNSVSQSAVTWMASSINTLPSTSLILLAIIFYFKYLEKYTTKWLVIAFFLIYVSLLFKETGIFLLLLLPICAFFYKKQNLSSFLRTYWYFFTTAFLIVVYRIWGFKSVSGPEALFLTGSSKYFFDSLVVRSVLYPLTSFALSIIPPEPFLNFARYVTNIYYPFIPEGQFILVAQTVILDFLATILAAIIGLVSLVLLKVTDSKTRKTIIFWFIFLFASFLPYVVISKSYSYLESRYYYLASVAWGIIFAWAIDSIIKRLKSNHIKYILLGIFFLFIYIHAFTVKNDIKNLVTESQTRISILNQIVQIKPKLDGNKNIFYVTGDTDFYLPGNKIPFQQGFGYTLLALYFPGSDYPKFFMNNTELFELGKEAYFESEGYGFGYFTDLKKLDQFLKNKGIRIIGLYFDSKQKLVKQLNPSSLEH